MNRTCMPDAPRGAASDACRGVASDACRGVASAARRRVASSARRRTVCVIAAAALAGACRPGEPEPPAPPTGRPVPGRPVPPPGRADPRPDLPDREPVVRIGITVDSAAAVVSAPAAFEIRGPDDAVVARAGAGERWVVVADGSGRLSARDPSGREIGPIAGPLRVVALAGDAVEIGGRGYRGEALVSGAANRVTAVNVVDIEAYLLGVVPREIGRRPANEMAAMKAQAVAARTYAIGNLGGRSDRGFDFYATIQDQVYGGLTDEDSLVSRAVHETRGEILTYDGAPIYAYYSSTCGGRTAAIEDSWPSREPLPYLRSVSDMIPGSNQAYCDFSSRFTWETQWTRAELLSVLGETLAAHTRGAVRAVRSIDDVEMVDRNDSGRATVRLTADGRQYTLRADSVRWVLRPTPTGGILNSSLLSLVRASRARGVVTGLEIRGGGWGHGIGMCQVGAMGRARAGHRYDEILRAYYTDTELTRLY
jgi:stage II sporulation protein D